jgi:hypothetical protein
VTAALLTGLLSLLPAVAILLSLLAGRYVGEERLARRRPLARAHRLRPPARLLARRPERVLVPRGTSLLAHALASRGPPSPQACITP